MPQLDQFTYLTQFVWLCVFYMTFYVLLFNDGLPKISRIFKLRAYLCSDQIRETDQNKEDTSNAKMASTSVVDAEGQDVLFRTLNSSVSYLNSSVAGAFNWCTKSVDTLNTDQLKSVNKSYLRSIGEISVSQLIKDNALEASAPLTCRSPSSMFLEVSQVWALQLQKCLVSSINKKKKRK